MSMMTIPERATPYAERLDVLHELLPALARALDVRDVFRQLSDVATRIIPHDEANLLLLADDGAGFRLYATTGDGAEEAPPQHPCSALHDLPHPPLPGDLP